MRSILFDEINSPDLEKIRDHLEKSLVPSSLPDVFWLELPPDLLSPAQHEHKECCGPHRVAVLLEEDGLKLELLVRSKASLRCECTAYTTGQQRDFLLDWADRLARELAIRT